MSNPARVKPDQKQPHPLEAGHLAFLQRVRDSGRKVIEEKEPSDGPNEFKVTFPQGIRPPSEESKRQK